MLPLAIVPRVVGMPSVTSVKDGAHDSNVDEAADSIVDPPTSDAGVEDENTIRNLRQEAKSLRHFLAHKPANKYCDACILGKMRGSKKFCGSFERSRQPTRWSELGTADHLVAQSASMEGITGDCDAIIIKDLFSKVKAIFPVFSKTGQEAENVLRRFFGDKKVDFILTAPRGSN